MLEGFQLVNETSAEAFSDFFLSNSFADTTFSVLYAWGFQFRYYYRRIGDVMLIAAREEDGRPCFFLIRRNDRSNPEEAFVLLLELCKKEGISFALKYVSEEELSVFVAMAEKYGLKTLVKTDERYDDYIYRVEDFLNLDGKQNRHKRENRNALFRDCPGIVCREYDENQYKNLEIIFDRWCQARDCAGCYYGCEKIAFRRFMKIYDCGRHRIMMTFLGETPLSFAAAERIRTDTVSYLFQKNACRQRGLTYYLNYEMAKKHVQIPYLNLAEDMGLPGLRTDKQGLHPCKMKKKYILFEMK